MKPIKTKVSKKDYGDFLKGVYHNPYVGVFVHFLAFIPLDFTTITFPISGEF